MANFLQALIPLALLLLAAAANTAAQSESTYFDYDFSVPNQVSLFYQGDAYFTSGVPYLRLTKTNATGYPATESVGRVVYANAVTFSADEGGLMDFATNIKFKITPVDNKPADGLAFFIAPYGTTIPEGSAGGNLGVFGARGPNSNVLAVEFDTFFNPGTDASTFPHVGIDIEKPISSNITIVGNGLIGQEVMAYITYSHASKKIVVSVTAGQQSFVVSYVHDLTALLSQPAQVGISAATGGSVAIHDIASWSFLSFVDAPGSGANIRQVA